MWLIVYYVTFMILGDFASYLIGLAVEWEWGSQVSLFAFLALYFFFLWVAWLIAVKLSDPAAAARAARRSPS